MAQLESLKGIPAKANKKGLYIETIKGPHTILFAFCYLNGDVLHHTAHTTHAASRRHSGHVLFIFRLLSNHGLGGQE